MYSSKRFTINTTTLNYTTTLRITLVWSYKRDGRSWWIRIRTETTVRHTKCGRMRGMVVGEGGRSSGVLLYNYSSSNHPSTEKVIITLTISNIPKYSVSDDGISLHCCQFILRSSQFLLKVIARNYFLQLNYCNVLTLDFLIETFDCVVLTLHLFWTHFIQFVFSLHYILGSDRLLERSVICTRGSPH